MAYNTGVTNTFNAYGQKGKKLSFANWISNISPEETPFVSLTGKESIDQVQFTWQVDSLAKANAGNAQAEGFLASPADTLTPTTEIQNNTQLLAKVISVSDTANATANYGRGRELMYQLEKAGAEIKRDLEAVFLNNGVAVPFASTNSVGGASATPRKTGGVRALIGRNTGTLTVNAPSGHDGLAPDSDFGAVVVKDVVAVGDGIIDDGAFESALWDITSQLYLAGAKANTIMVHPSLAVQFSKLLEVQGSTGGLTGSGGNRMRMFENRKDIDVQVNVVTDPLGQKFRVIYNRHMPITKVGTDLSQPIADEDRQASVFIFNSADWTQMVLRAPQRTELAKQGDSTQYMITMETGLRHRNPYASAWLTFSPKP